MSGRRKRRGKRIPLRRFFRVDSLLTGEQVGYLGNITSKGLLLYADRPVVQDRARLLPLRLALPGTGDKSAVCLTARTAWIGRDERTGLHTAGFALEGVSEKTRDRLLAFIQEFGLTD